MRVKLGGITMASATMMDIRYQRPIFYTTKPRIDITYKFSPAAKIVFDYEIHDTEDNALLTSARTIQAFTDQQYQLILENPEFFLRWKEKWGLL